LIENFESIPTGPLNGQRGWAATLAQVKNDPAQTGNKVASFEGAGAAGANLPLQIPEGTNATVFFRLYAEADTSLNDIFAGLSDVAVAGLGAFGDFEVQIGYAGAQILDTLRVRDGSTGVNEAAGEFLPRTWYKIWAVIDNAADTYQLFIQGGSFTNQVQVVATNTGNTNFVFRNSGGGPAGNDLIRFLVKSGSATLPGPALLDDIYLAQGRELTDPVGTPSPPLRITNVQANVATSAITLTWEGGTPPFQVEKAGTATGSFQSIGAAQSERLFTDPGAVGASGQGFYRVRQISGGGEQ
jgi:hypothetical protein